MLKLVTELKGLPHTLTQTDGETFRLIPYEKKSIEERLMSQEFRQLEYAHEILITALAPVDTTETATSKNVKKN